MSDRSETSFGFTLLDGIALVVGAAIASVHLRDAIPRGLTALGWGLVWPTFAGVALSAAGPFILLERRFGRRPEGYPKMGDWLWCLMGSPWVATAFLRPAKVTALVGTASSLDLYRVCLWSGIAAASLVAIVDLWKAWGGISAGARPADAGPRRWTEHIGLALAVAWPLQSGFGLVVAE
jgi:hypothetical protein